MPYRQKNEEHGDWRGFVVDLSLSYMILTYININTLYIFYDQKKSEYLRKQFSNFSTVETIFAQTKPFYVILIALCFKKNVEFVIIVQIKLFVHKKFFGPQKINKH